MRIIKCFDKKIFTKFQTTNSNLEPKNVLVFVVNLHEQLEHERQVRKKVIREEFQKAKEEQNEYLKQVADSKKVKSIEKRKGEDLEGKGDKQKFVPKVKQRKIADEYKSDEVKSSSKLLSKFFG